VHQSGTHDQASDLVRRFFVRAGDERPLAYCRPGQERRRPGEFGWVQLQPNPLHAASADEFAATVPPLERPR